MPMLSWRYTHIVFSQDNIVGLLLKLVTLPLTLLTLGVFWWVVNALMLMVASHFLAPEFMVSGFLAAFLGAILLCW